MIALLDGSAGAGVQNSLAHWVDFYRVFLTYLLEDPTLGLIIKPKEITEPIRRVEEKHSKAYEAYKSNARGGRSIDERASRREDI